MLKSFPSILQFRYTLVFLFGIFLNKSDFPVHYRFFYYYYYFIYFFIFLQIIQRELLLHRHWNLQWNVLAAFEFFCKAKLRWMDLNGSLHVFSLIYPESLASILPFKILKDWLALSSWGAQLQRYMWLCCIITPDYLRHFRFVDYHNDMSLDSFLPMIRSSCLSIHSDPR